MKIKSLSHRKRNAIILVSALALLLLTILVLEKTRMTNFIKDPTYRETSTGPTKEQLEEQKQTDAAEKAEYLNKNPQNQDAKPAEVPTDSETITLSATQKGEDVIVHNELHGQGYSSGTCKLTIRNGEKSVFYDTQIMYQPEYSMCAGFSVPISTVGSGSWTILLEVTPFNGETLSKTTTFEVQP